MFYGTLQLPTHAIGATELTGGMTGGIQLRLPDWGESVFGICAMSNFLLFASYSIHTLLFLLLSLLFKSLIQSHCSKKHSTWQTQIMRTLTLGPYSGIVDALTWVTPSHYGQIYGQSLVSEIRWSGRTTSVSVDGTQYEPPGESKSTLQSVPAKLAVLLNWMSSFLPAQ